MRFQIFVFLFVVLIFLLYFMRFPRRQLGWEPITFTMSERLGWEPITFTNYDLARKPRSWALPGSQAPPLRLTSQQDLPPQQAFAT